MVDTPDLKSGVPAGHVGSTPTRPTILSKNNMKRIGIIGSRRRDTAVDFQLTKDAFLRIYEEGDTIVSGGCPKGGDRFAELLAIYLEFPDWADAYLLSLDVISRDSVIETRCPERITLYKADWNAYGRSAGFKRNGYIANDSDKLIACVAKDRTGGTEDTIRKFLKRKSESDLILV